MGSAKRVEKRIGAINSAMNWITFENGANPDREHQRNTVVKDATEYLATDIGIWWANSFSKPINVYVTRFQLWKLLLCDVCAKFTFSSFIAH